MQTTCVIHGVGPGGESHVLGAVIEDSAKVKGALQQYMKAVGPMRDRGDFSNFIRVNSFKIAALSWLARLIV